MFLLKTHFLLQSLLSILCHYSFLYWRLRWTLTRILLNLLKYLLWMFFASKFFLHALRWIFMDIGVRLCGETHLSSRCLELKCFGNFFLPRYHYHVAWKLYSIMVIKKCLFWSVIIYSNATSDFACYSEIISSSSDDIYMVLLRILCKTYCYSFSIKTLNRLE